MKSLFFSLLAISSVFATNDFYYEFDKKVYIKNKIETKTSKSDTNIQEYETQEGKKVKFKNEIVVQCEKDIDCKEDIKLLGLNNIAEISKGFLFIQLENDKNIFEYSQKIHELDSVKIAHPNFIKERTLR